MDEHEFLLIEEVAEQLRIPKDTVRRWLRTRQLQGTKIGRLWRIRRDDLEAFLRHPAKEPL